MKKIQYTRFKNSAFNLGKFIFLIIKKIVGGLNNFTKDVFNIKEMLKNPLNTAKNLLGIIVLLVLIFSLVMFVVELKKPLYKINDFVIPADFKAITNSELKYHIFFEMGRLEKATNKKIKEYQAKHYSTDKNESYLEYRRFQQYEEMPNIALKEIGFSLNAFFNYLKRIGFLKNVFKYKYITVDGFISHENGSDDSWFIHIIVNSAEKDYLRTAWSTAGWDTEIALFIMKHINPVTLANMYKYKLEDIRYKVEEMLASGKYTHDPSGMPVLDKDNYKIYTEKAIEYLHEAIDLWPGQFETYINLGDVYFEDKNYDPALHYYDQAVRLNKRNDVGYYKRGNAYRLLKRYTEAITDYSHAIDINRDDVKAYNHRGMVYYRLKNFENAIADYKRAIEISKDFASPYHNLATVYFSRKQYDKSIEYCSKAIELKPDFDAAFYRRGLCYLQKNEYENAERDFTKAIIIKPTNMDTYLKRADTYTFLENYERAITDYARVISIRFDDMEVYYKRANLYFKLQEYQKAINDFSESIILNAYYDKSYYGRANVYYELEEYEKAIDDYSKALWNNPGFKDIYFDRANAYYHLKRYNEAVRDYTMLIEYKPKNTAAIKRRGDAYAHLSDYKNAIYDYSTLLDNNPGDIDSYTKRAHLYKLNNEHDKAIADFTQVIKADPYSLDAYIARAELHMLQGSYILAYDDLKMIIENNTHDISFYFYLLVAAYKASRPELSVVYSMIRDNIELFRNDAWNYLAAECFINNASVEDLIILSGEDTDLLNRAYCYAGYLSLIEADETKAREYLTNCIAIGARSSRENTLEYILAGVELGRLKKL